MTFPDCKQVLTLDHWHTPATDYPLATMGTARIHRSNQGKGVYPYWGIDGHLYLNCERALPITSLQIKDGNRWKTWMVDDPPQQRAMEVLAAAAHGKVLTSGLGLGLVCHELVKNPLVESITVVERNQDVIQMVQPLLPRWPPTIEIVPTDFLHYALGTPGCWDTIIVDLWVSSNIEEKMALFPEVVYMCIKLREAHPNAQISFHGFVTLSDVQMVPEETKALINKHNPWEIS